MRFLLFLLDMFVNWLFEGEEDVVVNESVVEKPKHTRKNFTLVINEPNVFINTPTYTHVEPSYEPAPQQPSMSWRDYKNENKIINHYLNTGQVMVDVRRKRKLVSSQTS